MQTQFLEHNGYCIAYQHHARANVTVLFLPGFRSDMLGAKATTVMEWCAEHNIGFAALDYRAHGQSSGEFRDFTIGGALEDALMLMDTIIQGPVIIIGSSMGGWITLLLALARKERVRGVIGIAAAPDFTERLIWNALSEEKRKRMEEEGELRTASQYDISELVYTHVLITEARNHLLLEDMLPLSMPIRLLQGMQDADVPWQTAMDISEKISGEDVHVTLVKDGDHRLSRREDLALLCATLAQLVITYKAEQQLAA